MEAIGLTVLLLAVAGCRSGMYQANRLPQEFRARPNPGDVSVNMARMTGTGYDSSLIGPDDLLSITIVTGRDGEKPEPVAIRVAKDGTIDVAPIGTVQVGNLDPVDASEQIAAAAIQRGIYVQPTITVEIKKKAVNSITVLGAVKNPGLHKVPRNSCDVVSAIAMAGGLTEEAGTEVEIIRQQSARSSNYTRFAENEPNEAAQNDSEIELAAYSSISNKTAQSPNQQTSSGGSITQRIDLAMAGSLPQADYRLRDRDIVMIKPRSKRMIHVGGLVKLPGQFELPHTEDVRLLDAIARAGGSSSIVADKVYIIRPVPNRQEPLVIQASLQRAKHDGKENLLLMEGDMVSIEQTPATAVFDTVTRLFHLTIGVASNTIF